MVVEEVSLVDRAANRRRFLIVKRDDSMDDVEDTAKGEVPDDSPLGMALAALEALTDVVDLLGTEVDDADPRIARLAEHLRATGEQLLSQAGLAEEEEEDTEKARTKSESVAENLDAAKTAVARVRRAKKPGPKEEAPPKPKKPKPEGDEEATKKLDLSPLTEGLAKLTESFKSLAETVSAQAQRLGRVEKQFGLPNSLPAAEPKPRREEEPVAWPLDLNNPLDRASVDKSLSFHE